MTTTPTLGLTQFEATDTINFLTQYNTDLSKIDTNAKANQSELDGFELQLAQKASQVELAIERERLNLIEANPGSTSGDLALNDIKVAFDGTVYNSPADSVRGQASKLSSFIGYKKNNFYDINTAQVATATNAYGVKTTALIDTHTTLAGLSHISEITVYGSNTTGNKIYAGTGYVSNGTFIVENAQLCTFEIGESGVKTFSVNFDIDSSKQNYLFATVKQGNLKFKLDSIDVKYYWTFPLSGIDVETNVNTDLQTIKTTHTYSTVSGNGIYFVGVKSSYGKELLATKAELIATHNEQNVIRVGDGEAFDFNEITDAIASITDDSATNRYTIIAYPKTYQPFVCHDYANRWISVIGVCKESCIVKSTSGTYTNPAAEIQCTGTFKNLTFISTHDDITTLPEGDFGSYAVHTDFYSNPAPYDLVFDNCLFKSYQTAGFGAGTRPNSSITLKNCECYNLAPSGFNTTQAKDYPSLLIHGSVSYRGNGQNVYLENCKGYSLACNKAIDIYRYDASDEFIMEMRNNSFWSAVGGTTHRISGTVSPLSFGNNISDMNYTVV